MFRKNAFWIIVPSQTDKKIYIFCEIKNKFLKTYTS
jgi:hypothetical protein